MPKARNIKTTIGGVLGFLALGMEAIGNAVEAGHFDGKSTSQVLAAVALLLVGLFARDYNVSSEGTVVKAPAEPVPPTKTDNGGSGS